MNKITHLLIVILFMSMLSACGGDDGAIPVTGDQSDLQLTVQSSDGESAFRQGEKAITYSYVVTNTGPQSLNGPVIVEDAPRQVSCPQLNTVGNLDDKLDFNESITCTAFYTPGESERSTGSVTNRARALVGGAVSNESTFTLGQAAATPAVENQGAQDVPGASQTPPVIPTATQGASTNSTETPSVNPTATQNTSAESTGTPS